MHGFRSTYLQKKAKNDYLQIDQENILKGIKSKVVPKYTKLTRIWKEPRPEAELFFFFFYFFWGVCVRVLVVGKRTG